MQNLSSLLLSYQNLYTLRKLWTTSMLAKVLHLSILKFLMSVALTNTKMLKTKRFMEFGLISS